MLPDIYRAPADWPRDQIAQIIGRNRARRIAFEDRGYDGAVVFDLSKVHVSI